MQAPRWKGGRTDNANRCRETNRRQCSPVSVRVLVAWLQDGRCAVSILTEGLSVAGSGNGVRESGRVDGIRFQIPKMKSGSSWCMARGLLPHRAAKKRHALHLPGGWIQFFRRDRSTRRRAESKGRWGLHKKPPLEIRLPSPTQTHSKKSA